MPERAPCRSGRERGFSRPSVAPGSWTIGAWSGPGTGKDPECHAANYGFWGAGAPVCGQGLAARLWLGADGRESRTRFLSGQRQHDASQLPHGQAGRDARARHSSILLPGLQRCSCLLNPRISRRLRPIQWRGQRDSPTQTCQDWHRFRYIADGGQMSKRVAKELIQWHGQHEPDIPSPSQVQCRRPPAACPHGAQGQCDRVLPSSFLLTALLQCRAAPVRVHIYARAVPKRMYCSGIIQASCL